MKIFAIFLLLASFCPTAFGQFNPEKPNLMQRAFYTEAQSDSVHRHLAELYNDKNSWKKRAALIRQGILDGAEIKKISQKKPKNIVIHSKKVLMVILSKTSPLKVWQVYTLQEIYIPPSV